MRNSHTPCIKTYQPTTPHVSHMPSQASSHADTSHMASCQWDPQAPLPSFSSQGCCQVLGKGAAALLRSTRGPYSRETCSQPTLPKHLPFPSPERSPQCRSLERGGLRGWQWRGDSQAVLGKDVGVCAGDSPPAWGCETGQRGSLCVHLHKTPRTCG